MVFVQGLFYTKEANGKRYNYMWNKKNIFTLIFFLF